MPAAIAGVLACLWAGELVARLFPGVISAPVAGILLLYAWCAARGRVDAPLDLLATTAHRHFALLFVPAGLGIVEHLDLVGANLLAIAGAIVIGTLVTIVATAATVQFLPERRAAPRPSAGEPQGAMHADI